MPHPNDIAAIIVDTAFRIHSKLGPGMLESVYETVLERDLQRRGLTVERQKPVSFEFEGLRFENGLTLDLLVEKCVVIEIKVARALSPVHFQQALSYVRFSNCRLGLLINFGAPSMREGIRRIANGI